MRIEPALLRALAAVAIFLGVVVLANELDRPPSQDDAFLATLGR